MAVLDVTEAFAQISGDELWLHGLHIPEYAQGTWTNHDPRRTRKLLLHRKEIDRLASQVAERAKIPFLNAESSSPTLT